MRLARSAFLFCVLLASVGGAQQAQPEQKKLTVTVLHTGDDSVGGQLAFAIREKLRRSAAFELVSDPANALFRVNLVTLDPNEDQPSRRNVTAIASVVFTMKNWNQFDKNDPQTWYPIFLTSLVVSVGSRAVDDSAQGLVADLDAAIEKFKRDMRRD